MFRALVVFCVILSAFAFKNAMRSSKSSMQMMSERSKSLPFLPQPPNLVGLVGNTGFDPAGFSNILPIKWLQEAEIKHCRVAMLGAAGFIASSLFQLPGEVHQVSAVAAHDVAVKSGALYQILVVTHFAEFFGAKAIQQTLEGSGRAPGDFGFDPLGFYKGKSEAVQNDLTLKELANGRLAMLAFGGMVTQAVLFDKGFPFF